jgi:hypothetical protein
MESNHTPEGAHRLAAGPQATLGSLSWAEAERVELSRVSPRSVFETGGLASLLSASVGSGRGRTCASGASRRCSSD